MSRTARIASRLLERRARAEGGRPEVGTDLRGSGVVATGRHRDDIQGLRGVAVLLVALCHAGVGFLRGGFVGVDVFFVLSGFLITGILLSGAAKRGYVSLGEFYSRRARRILPAATLTLIATALAAYELLNYVRAKQAVLDSLWASIFAANVHFAQQGTNYFDRGQPPSLVLHYWSLAVEEQFYLVWPALLSIALFGLTIRRGRGGRRGAAFGPRAVRRLLVIVAAISVASLAWSIYYTNTVSAAAYFSTFARAWELGIGALLAVASARVARVSRRLRALLGGVGLIAIVVAAVWFSAATPFPGWAALLPTLGSAFVIAAGIGAEDAKSTVGRLLAAAPLRYVGDRSYAFYLWHWPFLIVAMDYKGRKLGLGLNLLLLLAAFLVSMLSYRFFENPIRRARWSTARGALVIPASAAAIALVIAVTLSAINASVLRTEKAAAADARVTSFSTGQAVPRAVPLTAVVAAVQAARRGAKIPSAITPAPSQLLNDVYQMPGACAPADDAATTSDVCKLGDTSSAKTIVLIGDSHAEMWMPTLLKIAESDGWILTPLVKSGCHPNGWTGSGFAGTPPDLVRACHTWFKWAVQQAEALRPAVTVIAGCCPSPYPGRDGTPAARAFIALAQTMRRFSTSVVVVADNDGISKQPVDCLLAPHATMKTCTTSPPDNILAFNNYLLTAAAAHKFNFLWTRGWFCYQNQCPMVVAGTIVYRDMGHITPEYALRLVGPFRAAFQQCILQACPRPPTG